VNIYSYLIRFVENVKARSSIIIVHDQDGMVWALLFSVICLLSFVQLLSTLVEIFKNRRLYAMNMMSVTYVNSMKISLEIYVYILSV